MMNNSYERWLMDNEQQLWMTVMDGGRQFMEDGGGQSLVEHFAGNKTMYSAAPCRRSWKANALMLGILRRRFTLLLNHSGVLGSGHPFSYAHQFDVMPPFIAIIE